MQIKFTKTSALALAGMGLLTGVAATIGLQTHAATNTSANQTPTNQKFSNHQFTPPAAAGQVTAVSGSTITLTDKRSGTAYTVDTNSATIEKFTNDQTNQTTGIHPTPITITASQIAVGDSIMVEGTVSGSNITAKKIIVGMKMMGGKNMKGHGPMGNTGQVTAINGNTITLSTPDGKSISVDGSSANIQKLNTITISGIQIGDQLMVRGQNNNGTISATNILDGQMPKPQEQINQ
jgi:hypothetical protein